MPKTTKPIYIRCPRCELNYIKKKDKYCDVCKRELKLIQSDDDIADLELCSMCKINFVQNGEEVCESCKQEFGINNMDEMDEEINNWHKYISDDDEDDEEDEDIPAITPSGNKHGEMRFGDAFRIKHKSSQHKFKK